MTNLTPFQDEYQQPATNRKTVKDRQTLARESPEAAEQARIESEHRLSPNGRKTEPQDEIIFLKESADHEGHARCVNALHLGEFAYSDRLGWLAYNGKYFDRENAEGVVERAIVETLRARRMAAVKHDLEHIVKATAGSRQNVVGTREQLRSLVSVNVDDFDANPNKLNVNNGVLDLRTGQLTQHNREQRFTYCVPVDYDPEADTSAWVNFLFEAVKSDDTATQDIDMVEYIQAAMGYSITGHTSEEIMFYLYGPTRSGKGSFTETIIKLFGGKPLSTEVDFTTFTASREGDTQNFDLAPLKPCRFIAASESNKHMPLNPAKIKHLTGGNYVYCAYKHREHFSYRPQYKIWLASNHPVNVDVDDDAAWARVHVITFPNSHLDHEDKKLKERLASSENLRGVLRWIVDGAMAWYRLPNGLTAPERVKQDTKTQRDEQDYIKQFIDEMCEVDPDHWIKSSEIYQIYEKWCNETGVTPKKQNSFSQALKGKGARLERQRTNDGKQIRVIIGFKPRL